MSVPTGSPGTLRHLWCSSHCCCDDLRRQSALHWDGWWNVHIEERPKGASSPRFPPPDHRIQQCCMALCHRDPFLQRQQGHVFLRNWAITGNFHHLQKYAPCRQHGSEPPALDGALSNRLLSSSSSKSHRRREHPRLFEVLQLEKRCHRRGQPRRQQTWNTVQASYFTLVRAAHSQVSSPTPETTWSSPHFSIAGSFHSNPKRLARRLHLSFIVVYLVFPTEGPHISTSSNTGMERPAKVQTEGLLPLVWKRGTLHFVHRLLCNLNARMRESNIGGSPSTGMGKW